MDPSHDSHISADPRPAPRSDRFPALQAGRHPVVEVRDLVKEYGKIRALKGVSLSVQRGEIFGLLGQNGAGKTTMIKILLGIARLTSGEAEMLGEPCGTARVRKQIGYLPEDHRFPDYHSANSLLDFYGSLVEMPRALKQKRIEECLKIVGLTDRQHYKIRTYSKGMKQRLGIAQAMLHSPGLIFLDEPTDGVDPVGRREIRDLLMEMKSQGTTIFVNSHLLGEVELICDRVAILQRGELIREGDIKSLTEKRGYYLVGLAPNQTFPEAEVAALGYEVRAAANRERWEISLREGQSIDPVVDFLRSRQLSLRHLSEKRQSLEDLFLQTVDAAEPGVDRRPGGRQPAR